jgi:hypothetical protein
VEKRELPKAIKRAMRSLVGLAHELELQMALGESYGDLLEWKSGGIDPLD